MLRVAHRGDGILEADDAADQVDAGGVRLAHDRGRVVVGAGGAVLAGERRPPVTKPTCPFSSFTSSSSVFSPWLAEREVLRRASRAARRGPSSRGRRGSRRRLRVERARRERDAPARGRASREPIGAARDAGEPIPAAMSAATILSAVRRRRRTWRRRSSRRSPALRLLRLGGDLPAVAMGSAIVVPARHDLSCARARRIAANGALRRDDRPLPRRRAGIEIDPYDDGAAAAVERRRPGRPALPRLPQQPLPVHRREGRAGRS